MARFLLKGNAEWTLDVGALSESFAKEEESKTSESGLSYGDYLRILLYLTGQEKLTYRAMNLMEQNVRLLPDRENFRMDCMIGSMEIQCSYLSKPLFFGWFGSGEGFKGDYHFQEKIHFPMFINKRRKGVHKGVSSQNSNKKSI